MYFIHVDDLSEDQLERGWVWIAKYRPGSELLGYCNYYNRPITYYKGRCRAYTPKRLQQHAKHPITHYLGVKND